jgi:hypothetical protein
MSTRSMSRASRISAHSLQAGCRRLGAILSAGIFCASLVTINEVAGQAQQPVPDAQAPSEQVPQQPEGNSPNEPLGQQLSRSKGVIQPPAGIDPGIETPAPQPNVQTMPVIPPPGSPGGDPSIQPK